MDSGDRDLKTATINMLKKKKLKETILNKQCIIKYRVSMKRNYKIEPDENSGVEKVQ